MKIGYVVVAWSSPYLVGTLHSIPMNSRLMVIDNSIQRWPLAKAWNYGIERLCRQEQCDAVVVCNDDISLRPNTGEQLAQCLAEHPELLIVSGRHTPTDKEEEPELRDGCDFACFCTSARLLDLVGPFDEGWDPCHLEDNDMHRRIRLAGYEGRNYAPYFHHLNGTIRHDPERRAVVQATFPGLQQRYIRKWGGLPPNEVYTVPWNGGPET